jgi:hypothetical protein
MIILRCSSSSTTSVSGARAWAVQAHKQLSEHHALWQVHTQRESVHAMFMSGTQIRCLLLSQDTPADSTCCRHHLYAPNLKQASQPTFTTLRTSSALFLLTWAVPTRKI